MKRKNNDRKPLVWIVSIIALLTAMSIIVSAAPLPPQNDVIVDVTPDSQMGRSGDTLTYNVNLTSNGTVQDIIVVDSITGAPAGWAVKLKDAGVPQVLPYQTPLLASKVSHRLTLDVQIPANTTADATMAIHIYSYANHSATDSDTFECLVNDAPVLSSGEVSPTSGNATTTFTYSVNYTDADNHAPRSINVTIDGMSRPMTAIAGQDGDYTNGEIYEYTTTGALIGVCSHTFQFNASDGMDYATEGIEIHSGPIILDTDLPNIELISADTNIICVNVSGLNLSAINETHKPVDVTSQSAYLINSTGAGNFTLRFTVIANANTIAVYNINATDHWVALDTTTTTDTVTFTMDVEYPPVVVVFGTTPEETIAHHSGGGGDGTYPPGWFETPTSSVTPVPTETPMPVPTEKPAMTPTESPTPSTAVSSPSLTPTETPTTKLATKGIPGFESVYVIAGILTVAYLMFRRRWG